MAVGGRAIEDTAAGPSGAMDSARPTLGLRPRFVMAVLVTATYVLRPRRRNRRLDKPRRSVNAQTCERPKTPATPPSRRQTAAPFLRNPYGPFGVTASRHGSQEPSPRGGVKVREAPAQRLVPLPPHPRTRTSRSRDRRLAAAAPRPGRKGRLDVHNRASREPSWPAHIPNPSKSHNHCAEALVR